MKSGLYLKPSRKVDICDMGDSTLRTLHTFREQIFGKKKLFLHTSLEQFWFKICSNIHYMVLNCQHKRNFDFVYNSCQYFCFKLRYGHYKKKKSTKFLHTCKVIHIHMHSVQHWRLKSKYPPLSPTQR